MNFKTLQFNHLPIASVSNHLQKHEPKYLILALLVPVLLLLSLTFKPLITLQLGETIQLQTTPIDPTDLFRGDYTDLFYDMTQVELKTTEVKDLPSGYTAENLRGKMIYVILKPSENSKVYQVSHYSMTQPSDGLYLEGQIRYAYNNGISPQNNDLILNMNFGIDRYFIEENSGSKLEEAARQGKVLVTLKVYNGFGIVTDLEIQK